MIRPNQRQRVTVTHRPTGLSVTCSEGRSNLRNRAMAILVLRSMLAAGLTEPVRPQRMTPLVRCYSLDTPMGSGIRDRAGKWTWDDELVRAVLDRGELEKVR